jgi:hypothetical protein
MFDLHSPISSANIFSQPSQLPCYLNQDRYDTKIIVTTNHLHRQNLMRNASGQIRQLFSIETLLNFGDVFHTKTVLNGGLAYRFSCKISLRSQEFVLYNHIPNTAGNCNKKITETRSSCSYFESSPEGIKIFISDAKFLISSDIINQRIVER